MRSHRQGPIGPNTHLGEKIAVGALLLIGGAIAAFWGTSRKGEADVNARTRTRLLPLAPSEPPGEAPHESAAAMRAREAE